MIATQIIDQPRILVVDDAKGHLGLRLALLGKQGCSVVGTTTEGDARFALASRLRVNLVVADIHLKAHAGDTSGINLARWIKRTMTDLPVAGYSAYFDREDELPSGDLGIFDRRVIKGRLSAVEIQRVMEDFAGLARDHQRHSPGGTAIDGPSLTVSDCRDLAYDASENGEDDMDSFSSPSGKRHEMVLAGALPYDSLTLEEPLNVKVGKEGKYVVVWNDNLHEFGYGQDLTSALDDFRWTLSELYITLKEDQERLGPGLAQTWSELSKIIGEVGE